MPLRFLTATLVALALVAGPAAAEDREVMGEELETLLSDNSIEGMWGEGGYTQFFNSNGRTVYIADGRAPD